MGWGGVRKGGGYGSMLISLKVVQSHGAGGVDFGVGAFWGVASNGCMGVCWAMLGGRVACWVEYTSVRSLACGQEV